jgi:hypothetical protein
MAKVGTCANLQIIQTAQGDACASQGTRINSAPVWDNLAKKQKAPSQGPGAHKNSLQISKTLIRL